MSDSSTSLSPDLSTQFSTVSSGSVNLRLAIALPICLFVFFVIVIVVVFCLAKRKSWIQNSSKANDGMKSRDSVEGSSDLGENNNYSDYDKHTFKVSVESETLELKSECQPTHELSISLEKLRDLDLPNRQDMNLFNPNHFLADSSDHPPIKNEYGLPKDFQNVNFPSDNSLKRAAISQPEKTNNLINQLSASNLMKHSLLCKLKGKRRVNHLPEKQTLEIPSQTSSSNVLNLQNPEAMKVQKSSSESPPEIPGVSLPGSVTESSRTTLVEISKETSVMRDAMESSGEASSSSHLNKIQVETGRVTYSTCTDNDVSDTDFAGVIVPPPYEFAGGNAEVSDRFSRWDSVLESFDEILSSSFSDEIDMNPNAVIVNMAAPTMASGSHDETQGVSDVEIFDSDKHRSDKTGLSGSDKIEQFSEDILHLPFAPLGFNDDDNGEDLSAKFLDYFSRDVGDLDTSRFTETEPLPSSNQPAFSQTVVKRTYPVGVKTLAPKPKFPKHLQNFKSTNSINLRKTNVINSVKSFMPEDNVNKQEDCIDAIGIRTVDTPEKVSSASLLSTVPLPDVVQDFVSLDDCERFLVPPPADFSNTVVRLQDEATTTDQKTSGSVLPLEFTEADNMDCSIPETPQHFANASPESQAKDERTAPTPSASWN